MSRKPLTVIAGAGEGLSASLARRLHREGHDLVLAARNAGKLDGLAAQTGARVQSCDVSSPEDVAQLFAGLDRAPDAAIYNPSYRVRGALVELDPVEVKRTIEVCAFGAFLFAQQAARMMLAAGKGCIVFTGASAGVKGYPKSAPFAMGKFALRGLAQSMARELHPQNIHIAHIVIDGGIRSARRPEEPGADRLLDPDAIADSYWHVINQQRSSWSWEIEVRPWTETF
ncbi:MAG: SDR family NAD(P)-dependent oxidoreductase [Alphaproteobacteria bacterium]|nr:SDR family NAD(P)-dependent oxidoreductase [Alphaproteobacteria bacterium]